MKLAMVQMKIIAGDVAANQEKGLSLIRQAVQNVDTIIMPEIWTIGYALKNLAQVAETMNGALISELADIARGNGVNIIAGSLPLKRNDGIYNSALVFNRRGDIITSYDKVHLFSMYGEKRFFASGNMLSLFSLDGMAAGLGICYDLRFPELFRGLALRGAQVVFIPAEWPAARGRHWQPLIQARAIENHMYVCAVNCVGEHKGSPFYGHSLLVGPDGDILVEGDDKEGIIYGEIDLERVIEVRKAMLCFNDRRPDVY